jgi:hypothetical protein
MNSWFWFQVKLKTPVVQSNSIQLNFIEGYLGKRLGDELDDVVVVHDFVDVALIV